MNRTPRTLALVPVLGMALLPTLFVTQGTAHAQSVKNAVTSKGVEDNPRFDRAFKPIDVTTTFAPTDQTIYATCNLGRPMEAYGRSVWSAANVASLPQGTVISDMRTATLPNLQYLRFSFTQQTTWPVGTYRIDLYANEKVVKTLSFSVQ